MRCPLEAFFLGLISTPLLWKGVIPRRKWEGYYLNAPEEVFVEEGLCAVIPCNFTYKEGHANKNAKLKGIWKKGKDASSDPQEVANSDEMSDGDRFQLIGNVTAGNCSLLIWKAQKSDTGNYFFRMEKKPEAKFDFFVRVSPYLNVTEKQPPKIKISDTMRAGNSTSITCATFASCSQMPPKITWKGFPKPINSYQNILHLNGTPVYSSVVDFIPSFEDDKRNITCRVDYTDEITSVLREKTIPLNVTFEPQILAIQGEHFHSNKSQESFANISWLTVEKGDCLRLKCRVKGNPSPRMTWAKGTEVLTTTRVLKLFDLKPEDTGKYVCRATNQLASREASFELFVEDSNRTLLLTVTVALVMLGVIMLFIGIILASKRYWRKRKTATDSETGNTLTNVKEPNPSDTVVQKGNGVPSKPRSPHGSVDGGDPRDPEEIHYATLTFNAPSPKPDITEEETQTDYAEIRPSNSQRKDV